MEEHFCTKHNTKFFKTAKMQKYAHPIAGTKEWCTEENSDENLPQKQEPIKTESVKLKASSTPDYAIAFRGGIELLVNKIITPESELGKKVIKWANEKL